MNYIVGGNIIRIKTILISIFIVVLTFAVTQFMNNHNKMKANDDELIFYLTYYEHELDKLITQLDAIEHEEDLDKDRKSTRLKSSHVAISYAVFCLKKKNIY